MVRRWGSCYTSLNDSNIKHLVLAEHYLYFDNWTYWNLIQFSWVSSLGSSNATGCRPGWESQKSWTQENIKRYAGCVGTEELANNRRCTELPLSLGTVERTWGAPAKAWMNKSPIRVTRCAITRESRQPQHRIF